jgi:hypothetical protein
METANKQPKSTAYMALLVIQTIAVGWLFWLIIPIFGDLVRGIGIPYNSDLWDEASVAGVVIVLQSCYWRRYYCIPVYAPTHNVVVGHFLKFASRASFFFGGALFSAIFFRHIPELDALPPLGQTLARLTLVMGLLFALFCYSLELDRLGAAIEDTPHMAGPAQPRAKARQG